MEDEIEYERSLDSVYTVKLGGRVVGKIRPIDVSGKRLWQYFPKGSRTGGEPFEKLVECQRSLESK